jgi:hypothetical protein
MRLAAQAGLLVLLLALGQTEATLASLSIVLRVAFLSFDSPSTQHHDELATQAAPCADAAGETLAHARAAATATTGRVALATGIIAAAAWRPLGITRAPPAA